MLMFKFKFKVKFKFSLFTLIQKKYTGTITIGTNKRGKSELVYLLHYILHWKRV